jgi:hypothetical protein
LMRDANHFNDTPFESPGTSSAGLGSAKLR